MGEYQPRRSQFLEKKDTRNGDKKRQVLVSVKDGAPVSNYYPAAVTEKDWLLARAGAKQRRRYKGRNGATQINLFAGLLKHARDGDSYIMTSRLSRNPGRPARKYAVLVNRLADEGQVKAFSIPYEPFKDAIISCLMEIDPKEILPPEDDSEDESGELAAELASVELQIGQLEADILEGGQVASLARVLRLLEEKQSKLMARLEDAQAKAATPLSAAWKEAQTLAEAEEKDPLRFRHVMRRIVEEIRLLVVPRDAIRLAEVKMYFTGGGWRSFLFVYHPAQRYTQRKAGPIEREARWGVRTSDNFLGLNAEDLRDPTDAENVEGYLKAMPVDALREILDDPNPFGETKKPQPKKGRGKVRIPKKG